MTTTHTHEPYQKAAGSDRLAPYYDLMIRLGMRERAIKGRVIDLARLAPGRRMLDLGCGTGTLVLMALRRAPGATVIGVDGDPVMLGIARRKAEREGAFAPFDEGMAYALPYADESFDVVTATLMLHHLTHDQQARALAEVRRVLRPSGRLVIADFAPPHNRWAELAVRAGRLLTRLHGGGSPRHGGHTRAQLEHQLTAMGWRDISAPEYHIALPGTIAVFTATRPAREHDEHEDAARHG